MRESVGIDEAGRGPLAGPVAVGIVRTPANFDFFRAFPLLNDSKQLTEKKREAIYESIRNYPEIRWTVEMSDASLIDEKGIVTAIRNALTEGLRSIAPNPPDVMVFLDGSLAAPQEYEQETIIGGDAKIPAIMLASVLAKVTRDRYMIALASQYPEYGFEIHKGYGTKKHRELIEKNGMSQEHRTSFCRNILTRKVAISTEMG